MNTHNTNTSRDTFDQTKLNGMTSEQALGHVRTFVGKVGVLTKRDFAHALLVALNHFETHSHATDPINLLISGLHRHQAKTMAKRAELIASYASGITFSVNKTDWSITHKVDKEQRLALGEAARQDAAVMLATGDLLGLVALIEGKKVEDPLAKNAFKKKATALGNLMTATLRISDEGNSDPELIKILAELSVIELRLENYKGGLEAAKKAMTAKLKEQTVPTNAVIEHANVA